MQSLHLLIHGSSLEEMKSNLDAAWKTFETMYPEMKEKSNCLATEPEATTKNSFEFDMTEAEYLADLYPCDD